jgi:hypothetical protein
MIGNSGIGNAGTVHTAVFTCSICGEPSTNICAYCTKDACANHRCERCKRCSDCCECDVPLSAEEAVSDPVAETPAEAAPPVEPSVFAEPSIFAEPSVFAEPLESGEPDESPYLSERDDLTEPLS